MVEKNAYSPLKHPLFLAGLLVMLLNDAYLKGHYHNWLTGKLSDVVGLYVFPVFLCSLFPAHRRRMYWLTAVLFVFWKSDCAQPLIGLLHSVGLPFTRVVDYSDLLALLVLPLSFRFGNGGPRQVLRRINAGAIAVVSLLVFCSDSIGYHRGGPEPVAQYMTYYMRSETHRNEQEVLRKLDSMGIKYYADATIVGRYCYDTSLHTPDAKKVRKDERIVFRFYRIKNYAYGADTVGNINFRIISLQGKTYINVLGFDGQPVDKVNDFKKYDRQRKRLVRLIEDHLFKDLE